MGPPGAGAWPLTISHCKIPYPIQKAPRMPCIAVARPSLALNAHIRLELSQAAKECRKGRQQ